MVNYRWLFVLNSGGLRCKTPSTSYSKLFVDPANKHEIDTFKILWVMGNHFRSIILTKLDYRNLPSINMFFWYITVSHLPQDYIRLLEGSGQLPSQVVSSRIGVITFHSSNSCSIQFPIFPYSLLFCISSIFFRASETYHFRF